MPPLSAQRKVYKKRPHQKVKSGCQRCKQRKIKCDELRLRCSNCARYASECIYLAPAEPKHRRQSATPPTRNPESYSKDSLGVSHALHMTDLALMHQWSVATCYGFGDSCAEDAGLWRDQIPMLAQQFPFLMHGMLALSALHLAKNAMDHHSRVEHLQTAAHHQGSALPEYRSTLLEVTEENVVAVLAFSTLLTVYSLAMPKSADRAFAGSTHEWILLHRGAADIPADWQIWIHSGLLASRIHRRRLQLVNTSLNPEDSRLRCLESLIEFFLFEEANEAPVYQEALHWLRQAFAHTYCHESRLGARCAILFWIERVPQDFIDLIDLQRPRAMVFLANAAVLLKRAANSWYLEGFAEHVLRAAKQTIPPDFLPWIEWPMKACGVV